MQIKAVQNYPQLNNNAMAADACKVGKNLTRSEDLAMKAFAVGDDQKKEIAALAKQMGLPDPENVTAHGLRLAAQILMDKARSLYQMLVNLISAKGKTEEAVIRNIGR